MINPSWRRPSPANPTAHLILFALVALIALGTTARQGSDRGWPVITHAALAVGLFPLLLAAILHFSRVLTRTGHPRREAWWQQDPWWSWLALGTGWGAVLALLIDARGLFFALPLALLTALGVFFRITGWAIRGLGTPHPGLRWYQGALLFLASGMLGLLIGLVWPHLWIEARAWHLHCNLFGFIGLTAVGTLQVLIPTVMSRPDPETPRRCSEELPFSVAGALLLAIGATGPLPLYLVGALFWLLPPIRLLQLVWAHPAGLRHDQGALPPLTGALFALAVIPLSGLLVRLDQIEAWRFPTLFIALVIFPLLTGALTHLLPVWLMAGSPGDAVIPLRQRLARGGRVRTLLFLLAGLGFALGPTEAIFVSVAVLADFLLRVVGTILLHRRLVS